MADLGIDGLGNAELFASGGSALVYRAVDESGRTVAVKVLRGMRGNEVERRFERELSAAERLQSHPAIIEVLASGLTAAGEPYLIMPLFSNGSLQDELETRGAASVRSAVRDVQVACSAIQHAHAHGVLHRDLKPGNLLRADDGSIVVTDFGIARVTDAGISSATVGASTPLYAAPELLSENAASIRSEVYSLGALLYTLLAGAPAFSDTANIWGSIHRIQTEPPPPIAGVPAPVMAVIAQAMQKEPQDRPGDVGLLSAYLREALDADPEWTPPKPAPMTTIGHRPPAPATRTDEHPVVVKPAVSVSPSQPFDAPQANDPVPPPLGRPVPPASRIEGSRRWINTAAVLAAIVLVAGLGWFALDTLSGDDPVLATDAPGDTPIVAPSPQPTVAATESDEQPTGTDESTDESTDTSTDPNLVTFSGSHFRADLPLGWSVAAQDIDVGYGFRSRFVAPDMYLTIDTTPAEQRTPGGDVEQSARDIAQSISSASPVVERTVDGTDYWSFTFVNNSGVDSIDIFFEHDGNGYAVVAGSASDPDEAFATARQVAQSIRSN